MAEEKRGRGTFWGFIIGGAIGGLAALLYAPKPGKELRTDISKKTNKILEDGKKKSVELWETTKTRAGSMIDNTSNLFVSGKEKLVNEAEKMKGGIKAGVDAYSEEENGQKHNTREESGRMHKTRN